MSDNLFDRIRELTPGPEPVRVEGDWNPQTLVPEIEEAYHRECDLALKVVAMKRKREYARYHTTLTALTNALENSGLMVKNGRITCVVDIRFDLTTKDKEIPLHPSAISEFGTKALHHGIYMLTTGIATRACIDHSRGLLVGLPSDYRCDKCGIYVFEVTFIRTRPRIRNPKTPTTREETPPPPAPKEVEPSATSATVIVSTSSSSN